MRYIGRAFPGRENSYRVYIVDLWACGRDILEEGGGESIMHGNEQISLLLHAYIHNKLVYTPALQSYRSIPDSGSIEVGSQAWEP